MLCFVLPPKSEALLWALLVARASTHVDNIIKYRVWETPDKEMAVVVSPNHSNEILIMEMNKDRKPAVL